MITTLQTLWAERSQREQWLLGIMFALLGAFALWFLVLVPLRSGLEAAKLRHERAVHDAATVRAKATALKALTANPPPALGAPVPSFVAQSATDAGFTLSRNDPAGSDGAIISIVSAKAPAFFAWIAQLETRGVFVDRVSIRTNSDATVAVDAQLKFRARS